jgi:hypothetical protein
LVKENNVLLSLFFAAYLILRKAIFKADLRVRDLLAATLIPGVIVGVIYVLSAGSIYRPIEVAKIILASPATNKYAILFCSGPWFRCLIDFMLLSPWVCLLAIGFFFHYLVKNEKREEIVYLLLFCSSLIFLFSFFAKNVRYVINLDFPIRLFAVLMLVELKKLLFKNRATYILVAFVCLIALFDYLNFYNLFAIRRIYDPISQWLLQAWRIVPLGA